MARSNYRGGTRRAPKDLNRRVKKKPCAMCRDNTEWVDYKDVSVLRKYMSDRGKIRSRRVTGNCAQHQRDIARAIKTARELVLLPYTQRTVTERPGGRGGRGGPRGDRGPGAERTLASVVDAGARAERSSSEGVVGVDTTTDSAVADDAVLEAVVVDEPADDGGAAEVAD